MFEQCKFGLQIPTAERAAAVPNVFEFIGRRPLVADSANYTRSLPSGLWGMLGNGDYGCCFWAGAANLLMSQQVNSGQPVHVFTTEDVLSFYGTTGFRPDDPSTDRGTDPIAGMLTLQDMGLIEGFAQVPVDDDAKLATAIELFGGVMLGVQVPRDWLRSTTWGLSTEDIVGAHAVIAGGYDRRLNMPVLTWAEIVSLLAPGWKAFGFIALVAITRGWIQTTGRTLQGFDLEGLKRALTFVR